MNKISKKCKRCRFGRVKIEVLAPETYNVEECVKETQKFANNVAQTTGEKPIHYSLTIASPADSSHPELDFKVHWSCNLNLNQNNCSVDSSIEEEKPLLYNKTTSFEEIAFQLAERELSS